ncbi:MAG: heparinase II/III family protein [Armatimonadetes bacterium]|nr:heparinase II/III family protein [Armatimonadota bacterium]
MSGLVASGLGVAGVLLPLTVAVPLTNGAGASAEPRTLYKPKDIQNARENIGRYPWARAILESWKESAAFALAQDRPFFEAMISDLTPGSMYGHNCPACVGRLSRMGEEGLLRWSLDASEQLTCSRCGTLFPDPRFPETGRMECRRMGQTFTYYETEGERAHPEERAKHAMRWNNRPVPTSFSGAIRFHKAAWAIGRALPLAKLYALTDDVRYAERAAWILDRFARVFPHYLYHSYDGTIADCPPEEAAANMGKHGGGGRFPKDLIVHPYGNNQFEEYATLYNGFWGAGRCFPHGMSSDAGPLVDAAVAYDLIRDARYPDGRRVLDADMEKRIVDDLLAAGCADYENWNDVSNKGIASRVLSAAVGVLLQRPESVRRALAGFDLIMETKYHLDGFYAESPAYASHNYLNMRDLPDLLLGYSDPPGYRPEKGPRLESLNLYQHDRFRLALLSMARMLAPGNRLPVIGDTWHETPMPVLFAEVLAARLGGEHAGILETAQGAPLAAAGGEYALWYRPADLEAPAGRVALPLRTEWFPGWHVGVLRAGDPQGDTALYFNGNERHGHRHEDTLSVSYYAFGEELASDRGYFSGGGEPSPNGRNGQYWTRSTASHNIVLVDEKCQSKTQVGAAHGHWQPGTHAQPAATRGARTPGEAVGGKATSDLELFGIAPGIEVVQASAPNAYPQCAEYRRTSALIRTPGGQTYAVDFFRVKGGENHKYCFHCNGSLVKMAPAQPAPEPVALPPAWDEWAYTGWVENPRAVVPEMPYTFTWKSGDVSLDLRLLNSREALDRILLMDAPGWRRARLPEFEKPPIQEIMAEHRAGAGGEHLATQYAAVIVPYKGAESPVLSARLLANDPESGVLAVEARFADRTDYIISAKDQQRRQFGPLTISGEFAFLSADGQGQATEGYLLNGTLLECGDFRITLPEPNRTLKVRSVSDRTIHLAEPLPAGVVAPGSYLLAPGGQLRAEDAPPPQTGFEVESTTADSITVRDYPPRPCEEVVALNSRWASARR